MKIQLKCSFDRALSVITTLHTIFTQNREKGIVEEPPTLLWLGIEVCIDCRESLAKVINRFEDALRKIFDTIAEFAEEQQQAKV